MDYRKGEVNELKALLRNRQIERDPKKRREAIKKVIGYQSLGIDVSKLFSEMVMAVATNDLVVKKMVYFYLTVHAEQKPELALLAINTLQKDCRDDDPMVRGLALRSLCSLRLPQIIEYVIGPIRSGLLDASPYVRKTAVMGCAKIFSMTQESSFVDVLYNMLRDRDAQVISNAIVALNEILRGEGGIAVNKSIVAYLLSRLKDFSEWGQCTILDLVAKYQPENSEEIYEIMNVLEDRLRHANSAVVLAAIKVFLYFSRKFEKLHLSVYERLKAPLMTLMATNAELSYPVLGHLSLLVSRSPESFQSEYKSFYCRYNDPACVKSLKVEILTLVASEMSHSSVIAELIEYVSDVDPDLARIAINAVAKIGIRLPCAIETSISSLLGLLEMKTNYVSSQVCIMLKDLLRKYPDRYQEVVSALEKCLSDVDDPEGKAAIIWMIGEYGDLIRSAPYILEPLIDSYSDDLSAVVRVELLSATVKLFFKRPPEVQQMLGRLLKLAIEDSSNIDVRDRALFYYRLLRHDVHEAARVVHGAKQSVDAFIELDNEDVKERLFEEFNKLSVMYRMPSDRFINLDLKPTANFETSGQSGDSSETLVSSTDAPLSPQAHISDVSVAPSPSPPAASSNFDLLDDLFQQSSPASMHDLILVERPTVEAPVFQSRWMSLSVTSTCQFSVKSSNSASLLEGLLARKSIATLASGTVNGMTKLYSFAQDAGSKSFFFAEILVNCNEKAGKLTIKSETAELSQPFQNFLLRSIDSLLVQ